jgi:hypothetical protein
MENVDVQIFKYVQVRNTSGKPHSLKCLSYNSTPESPSRQHGCIFLKSSATLIIRPIGSIFVAVSLSTDEACQCSWNRVLPLNGQKVLMARNPHTCASPQSSSSQKSTRIHKVTDGLITKCATAHPTVSSSSCSIGLILYTYSVSSHEVSFLISKSKLVQVGMETVRVGRYDVHKLLYSLGFT